MVEAASLQIPVVNVGIRQRGRKSQGNVIFVDEDYKSIENGIFEVTSHKFLDKVKGMKNIYGDGYSAQRAYDIIKNMEFDKFLDKKEDPLEYE